MIEKKNIEDYNEEDLYIYNKDIIISNLVVEYNELVDLYNELLKENEEQQENKQLQERIDKAIELIDLIKPELWNISNKMTYKLIDIKEILKGDK